MADILMTVEEVAKYLKVEQCTIYTLAKGGKIQESKSAIFGGSKRNISINGWKKRKGIKEIKEKNQEKYENKFLQTRFWVIFIKN